MLLQRTTDDGQRTTDDAFETCELCPRRCGINRVTGQKGFCRAGTAPEIFRYGAHHGEEPPISGTRGSGTVFFSRCTLRCLYCQNYPWSQEGRGAPYRIAEMADVLRRLRQDGCHNWNLVSPTPWLPAICEALMLAQGDGQRLPVVYNTSGYERSETIRSLRGVVDIYLTDLRYARARSAEEGSGAADYVDVARAAFLEMWNQAGPLKTSADGLAVSGVICRLLVLPGRAEEACENLRWMARTVGRDAAVSVMAQYTPAYHAAARAPWNRRIFRAEYEPVCREVEKLGFTQGWVQDYDDIPTSQWAGFNMQAQTKSDVAPFCLPAEALAKAGERWLNQSQTNAAQFKG